MEFQFLQSSSHYYHMFLLMARPRSTSRNKTNTLTGQLLFLLLPYGWMVTSTNVSERKSLNIVIKHLELLKQKDKAEGSFIIGKIVGKL